MTIDMRAFVEEKIQKDFDEFDFSDKPMEKYCAYNRTKHIQMAAQIVMNAINFSNDISMIEIDDLIHGLNHIFFNGVSAGQSLEWFKGKDNE